MTTTPWHMYSTAFTAVCQQVPLLIWCTASGASSASLVNVVCPLVRVEKAECTLSVAVVRSFPDCGWSNVGFVCAPLLPRVFLAVHAGGVPQQHSHSNNR